MLPQEGMYERGVGSRRCLPRPSRSTPRAADRPHPHVVAAIMKRSLILLTGGLKYRGDPSEGRDELPQFDHVVALLPIEVLVGHDAVLVLLAQVAARLDQCFRA